MECGRVGSGSLNVSPLCLGMMPFGISSWVPRAEWEVAMQIDVQPVDHDLLREGSVWDERVHARYWGDHLGQKGRRFTPAMLAYEESSVPDKIGCIGLGEDSDPVLAQAAGFSRLDLSKGAGLKDGEPLDNNHHFVSLRKNDVPTAGA
jgi:sugar lactone lactonase YvrE